jgi:hypothetical protein
MTALAVVGAGMASPLGLLPSEHAFFVRAGTGPAAPGAFLDDQGETMNVAHCPWLGAGLPVAMRLAALGARALVTALAVRPQGATTALFACTAAPRAGLAETDREACEKALCRVAKVPTAARVTGEAGFFHALAEAAALLGRGSARFAAVVATDSLVAPALLADWRRIATTPWESNLPRPAEGAAALLLTLPSEARREGIEVLATIHKSACAFGEANDDNDAIVDGAALTTLLRGVPRGIAAVFGQQRLGSLRRRDWAIASARAAEAFRQDCVFVSIEHEIGCLGAAAGGMNLAHGIAVHRHRAWPIEDGPSEPRQDEPFLAWALSRDGTRGLCTVSARG